jgi:MFS family permease
MRPRITDRNIWLIYVTILFLGLAYGLAIAIISLWLDETGYTEGQIGTLAAWFALGILAFSVPAGWFIKRFSAKSLLVLSLAGYAVAVTAFPYLGSYAEIAVVRFFDGAFSVGIWVSCETILLQRAPVGHRAYVTSLYALAMAFGYVVGPIVSSVVATAYSKPTAFVTAGVLAGAVSLLAWWRLDADDPSASAEHERADPSAATEPPVSGTGGEDAASPSGIGNLVWRIKTSCLATFAYGYFQASVVLLMPLFMIHDKGFSQDEAIRIPAFFALGMLLFCNVAGRFGDRYGHLLLMRILSAIGTGAVVSFIFLETYAAMCLVVFIGGASLASVSPVSLALQGVVTRPREYSTANGIYNFFYAFGMLLGPPVSAQIVEATSYPSMLYHLAAMWAAFVLFTVVFASDDPARKRSLEAVVAPRAVP